jgi:hypothetical protein
MQSAIVPMPVTIEQVAVVVRSMSRKDRQRLLELVPQLRETQGAPLAVQATQAPAAVEQLRQEILAALDGRLLAADEPFLDSLTLSDYLDLPDAERAHLWDKWTAPYDLVEVPNVQLLA